MSNLTNSTAVPVGVGVPKPKHSQVVTPALDLQVKESTDAPEWLDTPSVKDQILRGEDFCRFSRAECRVFDLSNAEHLEIYNDILTRANLPGTNMILRRNDVQFVPGTGEWRVLLEIHYVKFLKIFIKENKKT
jgi:hypothetical protein